MGTDNTKRSKQNTRPRLDRQLVLQKAFELADSEGVQALTMRRLAQELAVEAMSLYHHVANKDQLLDGLIDLVFTEIAFPPRDQPWKSALRHRALSARAALVRHPWAIGLMDSRSKPGPATLRHHEAVLACFRENGFSVAATAHAYSLFDSYIYGFALQEMSLPFTNAQDATDIASSILSGLSPDEYPRLREIALEHTLKTGYNYADEYEIGLELILESLETLRNTT
jgi:AcrR family transcriptional regulator